MFGDSYREKALKEVRESSAFMTGIVSEFDELRGAFEGTDDRLRDLTNGKAILKSTSWTLVAAALVAIAVVVLAAADFMHMFSSATWYGVHKVTIAVAMALAGVAFALHMSTANMAQSDVALQGKYIRYRLGSMMYREVGAVDKRLATDVVFARQDAEVSESADLRRKDQADLIRQYIGAAYASEDVRADNVKGLFEAARLPKRVDAATARVKSMFRLAWVPAVMLFGAGTFVLFMDNREARVARGEDAGSHDPLVAYGTATLAAGALGLLLTVGLSMSAYRTLYRRVPESYESIENAWRTVVGRFKELGEEGKQPGRFLARDRPVREEDVVVVDQYGGAQRVKVPKSALARMSMG